MISNTVNVSGQVAGVYISGQIARETEGEIGQSMSLAAAKSGELTTRTDDDTGTLTMEEGHGIETADIIDLYWDGGRQYNVVVGTVAGNSVPIDGGLGDVLPAAETEITAQVHEKIDMQFDGDLLEIMVAHCAGRGHVGFFEGATFRLGIDLAANEPWLWATDSGFTNPLATYDIDGVYATQAETAAHDFKLLVGYDSMPS